MHSNSHIFVIHVHWVQTCKFVIGNKINATLEIITGPQAKGQCFQFQASKFTARQALWSLFFKKITMPLLPNTFVKKCWPYQINTKFLPKLCKRQIPSNMKYARPQKKIPGNPFANGKQSHKILAWCEVVNRCILTSSLAPVCMCLMSCSCLSMFAIFSSLFLISFWAILFWCFICSKAISFR